MAAAAQGGRAATGQQGGGRGGAGPPRIRSVAMADACKGPTDGDGFTTVAAANGQRAANVGGTVPQCQVGTASGSGNAPQGQGVPRTPAAVPASAEGGGSSGTWTTSDGPGGGDGDQTMLLDDGTEHGDDPEGGTEHYPSEGELRGYWEAAKEMLAFTKRQGHPEDHPVRRNAQCQVDEAFARWRAAAPPKAVHARMGWAEEALRRARRAQERAEHELEELDRQYELDRQQKLQALDEARERTRARAQKLADISKEAVEEYQGDAADDEGNLLRGTFQTIDTQVGPALETVLATMEEGSEQHKILRQTLLTVATMHSALGIATGGPTTDYFDMAAEDGGAEATVASPAEGGAEAAAAGTNMDTTSIRAPRWLEPKRGGEPDPASTTGVQPPRWKKNRADDGGTSRSAAPSEGAQGTAEGSGGAPAASATSDTQDDGFEQRRRNIIAQASAEGIAVPGDYLNKLCPEALEEWAAEHLL